MEYTENINRIVNTQLEQRKAVSISNIKGLIRDCVAEMTGNETDEEVDDIIYINGPYYIPVDELFDESGNPTEVYMTIYNILKRLINK